MSSRFAPRARGPTRLIYWSAVTSPLGVLYPAVSRSGLCAVAFERHARDVFARLSGTAELRRDRKALAPVAAELAEYFAGARKHFDLPLDLSLLTAFQREVLAATAEIPWGETRSYQSLAAAIGRPNSSHPVGQALGRNPVPLVIPCHRVIASDASLGGYCGRSGLDIKRWLLGFEGTLS